MEIVEWICRKRDGHALNESQIEAIIRGCADESIPDYQLSALSMAIYFQGMDRSEVVSWTRHTVVSGKTFAWPDLDRPVVDKHSTGGIGDKISIVLAPLLAAAGFAVPMISGRGLGATGGTLDKLEAIPGFRVHLSPDQVEQQVRKIGCVIAGASAEIAPADRRLYALRDVTGTVPSIPLITGSILGKKLAEGLDALVLDVKCGNGAFMKDPEKARLLASSLVTVAEELGVRTLALLTDMDQPNGRMIGNALEVNEAVEVLSGTGPPDVRELTLELAAALGQLVSTTRGEDNGYGRKTFERLLEDGSAMECFLKMVHAQQGKWSGPLPCAEPWVVKSASSGFVHSIAAEELGWILIDLGGGRRRLEDRIDPSTGLEMLVRCGDAVKTGQPLARLFCHTRQWDRASRRLLAAITIGGEAPPPRKLVLERIEGTGSRRFPARHAE